ncbi:MAG: efflux RND transporter periplasmic adaptor subunit [Citromicrobium sp.]|nr:MAG: efflux RND transporter periplasmic adaptor subunit [Citromicrobium sp.]
MHGFSTVEPSLEGVGAPPADKRRRYLILAVLFALGAALAAWYFMRDGSPAEDDKPAEQVPVVTVIAPGRATIEGTISATGTLAARRELPVGAVGEGGRVVSVTVDQGDWVRQGQVLVAIDREVQNQQAASASAQIQVAQADANLAQSNLNRALQLVDRGFISKADVDRLTATRDAAAARVRVAQAQARELRERTARLNVYAPASGLVLARNVEPGQVVSGGSGPLFTIAQGGEMELLARVGEDSLRNLAPGTSATVTPVGTDQEFTGQVWQIAPTIDEATRQGTARIALAYAAGLRPGGFATATINSGTVVAPMLPESAIQTDDNGSFVWIVGQDNRVKRQAVKTGLVTNDGIAIIEGLAGTERVVLRAGGFLSEGDRVSPRLQRRN